MIENVMTEYKTKNVWSFILDLEWVAPSNLIYHVMT
jgi:hypothetical protein